MRIMLTLAAAALLTVPAVAQHEGHDQAGPAPRPGMPMAMEGGMGMPLMMEIHTWRPQALLERRELLGLTDPQAERLSALAAGAQQAHDRAHEEVQQHLRQAAEAWEAGNGDQASTHAAAAMQSMQQAHLAMLGAASQARGVLTVEQRARVQGWLDVQRMQRERVQQMRGGAGPPPAMPRRPGMMRRGR